MSGLRIPEKIDLAADIEPYKHLTVEERQVYDGILSFLIFLEASDEGFYRILIANYLLEGLCFYNGFNLFYNLASRHLMIGTSEVIRYINRDELTHCVLFELIVREIRELRPEFFPPEEVEKMFRFAVGQEIDWTNHIIGGGMLGVSEETTEMYTKWLANERWNLLGFQGRLYEGFDKNPYQHLEKLADTEGEGDVKNNFFEATLSAYNQSSVVDGWDDF